METITHGDALILIRAKRAQKEKRLEALRIILNDGIKNEYSHLTKPEMWELITMLFDELMIYKNQNRDAVLIDREDVNKLIRFGDICNYSDLVKDDYIQKVNNIHPVSAVHTERIREMIEQIKKRPLDPSSANVKNDIVGFIEKSLEVSNDTLEEADDASEKEQKNTSK